MCADWDPDVLRSPDQPVTPKPIRLGRSVPFAVTLPMTVSVPPIITGRVDGFIDDLINVFLDTAANCQRQPHVVPLVMFVTSRPHAGDKHEPIQRRAILLLEELLLEGAPAEIQIVLGWLLDTHRLLVALPDDKYNAWTLVIDEIVLKRHCTKQAIG
jgi:hypothetical protein